MKRSHGAVSLLALGAQVLSTGPTETGAQVLPSGPGEAAPTQPFGGLTGRIVYAGETSVPMRPVGYQTNEVILDNNSPAVTWPGSWFNSFSTLEPPSLAVPEVQFNPTSIVLTWTDMPGKRYRVQYKANLIDGPSINLGQEVTAGSTSASLYDPVIPVSAQRYHRVSLVD